MGTFSPAAVAAVRVYQKLLMQALAKVGLTFHKVLYRGVQAQLDYAKDYGDGKRPPVLNQAEMQRLKSKQTVRKDWYDFTSTSPDKDVAKGFTGSSYGGMYGDMEKGTLMT